MEINMKHYFPSNVCICGTSGKQCPTKVCVFHFQWAPCRATASRAVHPPSPISWLRGANIRTDGSLGETRNGWTETWAPLVYGPQFHTETVCSCYNPLVPAIILLLLLIFSFYLYLLSPIIASLSSYNQQGNCKHCLLQSGVGLNLPVFAALCAPN